MVEGELQLRFGLLIDFELYCLFFGLTYFHNMLSSGLEEYPEIRFGMMK